MKKIFLALLATALLGGCNTIEGIGKDVEATGKVVKDTAHDTKERTKK